MAAYDYGRPKRRRGMGTRPPRITPADKGTDYSTVRDSEARIVPKGGTYAPKPAPQSPGNVSTTRTGSTGPKQPQQRTYVSKGEVNQTGNARNGQNFATFTVKGRPGEYHEYIDPKTGKRTVKHVGPSSLLNSLGGS